MNTISKISIFISFYFLYYSGEGGESDQYNGYMFYEPRRYSFGEASFINGQQNYGLERFLSELARYNRDSYYQPRRSIFGEASYLNGENFGRKYPGKSGYRRNRFTGKTNFNKSKI